MGKLKYEVYGISILLLASNHKLMSPYYDFCSRLSIIRSQAAS